MSRSITGVVEEHGNGLPDVGDYVCDTRSGELYRVTGTGRIHAAGSGTGRGNYFHVHVELADWDDCPEGEEHESKLTLDALSAEAEEYIAEHGIAGRRNRLVPQRENTPDHVGEELTALYGSPSTIDEYAYWIIPIEGE